ncbi:tRNA-uridine aminocarboxypropyltransferase [Inhella proteolytica]|uniref:tRNA-uridine aminocarboxypropyltransferase n=1 Tax=Inhella proteolytica TaxID=2795029 RepID=A0A931J2C5_9BURK|nr:tRNA-uridine aminocarboxypropyltransferase [Inhella proteolytica]MBH9578241.1 DTW domain-containing protein [Inhella proteolytica]
MRSRCARCLRARCLCALLPEAPLAHQVELVILQHPLEQHEVKGTARLLALALARCELRVGEQFSQPPNPEGRTEALLYPGEPAAAPPGTAPQHLRLYVLDGTWRKSRLLLHRHPWLAALPRVNLAAAAPSAYTVRKAHAAHQLSTLEACAAALQQLEGLDPAPLLQLQARLLSALQAARPAPTVPPPGGSGGTPGS